MTTAPDQPQAVPDMVLVPREPTAEMVEAMRLPGSDDPDHEASSVGHKWVREEMYAAALAARPVLPVETPAEGLREAVEDAIRRNMGMIGGRVPVQFGSGLVRDICAVLSSPTPAPLSGRDGSLREALKPFAERVRPENDHVPDIANAGTFTVGECRRARAALAAVPPETAEMEGAKPVAIWRHAPNGNNWLDVQGDWRGYDFPAKFPLYAHPADRLAARASSSGEAGDE